MSQIDFASLDLNLLLVLDALLDERHVTRAAKRLGRSQSATSHALSRLRTQFGDPLLVRAGGEMRPTPRAAQVGPELKRLLGSLQRLLGADLAWDPSTTTRTFVLAGPDFLGPALPALVTEMASAAPGASVELVRPERGVFDDVADARFDICIAPSRADIPDGVERKPLSTLEWRVFARDDHPALANWSLETWLRYPHVRIRTASRQPAPVDDAVRAIGQTRTLGPALPHFALAPPLLASTDYLLCVPSGALAAFAPRYDLVSMPCPIPIEPLTFALYRSTQFSRDHAVDWFEERLRCALDTVW